MVQETKKEAKKLEVKKTPKPETQTVQNQQKPTTEPPKKSNTLVYCCASAGCCSCLIILIIILFWALSFFGVFNFPGMLGGLIPSP